MEFGNIERELHIDASPEVVFEVLTSPEHIRDWWSTATDEPTHGTRSRFTWTDEATGRQESVPFTVVEVDPPRRFSFRWIYEEHEDAGPGNSLLVTFDLVAAGSGTTLRFSETGYRERGWEPAQLEAQYRDNTQGWDFYLPRLAEHAAQLAAR